MVKRKFQREANGQNVLLASRVCIADVLANEGVADWFGHRLMSRTGVMLPSVVGALAATLCQVQERFPRAYLKSVLRHWVSGD